MKTRSKALLLALCAVLLVAASVFGTMAYLTSTDEVKNTFTVGQVKIELDEAKVGDDGKALTGDAAARVKANSYKLMPGHTYDKDPTVTVKAGSEASYIKMTVTVNFANEFKALFDNGQTAAFPTMFKGYDSTNWIFKGATDDTTANTRTYEFWYKETVAASSGDVKLDALFDKIEFPTTVTGDQLKTLTKTETVNDQTVTTNLTITVNAYAIQADGFAADEENGKSAADAAWAAFGA